MSGRLTESIDFHGRALLLRAERQKVLASNIANADTPGFAARDFDFRAALAEATGQDAAASSAGAASASKAGAARVAATHPGHLGGGAAAGRIDSTAVRYRAVEQPSLDANTVDLDRERANFADNALRYEAGLRFINGSVRTLLSAIRGE
jgi:flagellar basal-body rod protein FlgB